MQSDVLVIGSITYNVNERVFTADSVSKQCVMRQCVEYEGKKYFYFDFLNTLLKKMKCSKRFHYMDIPTANGKELYEYLKINHINVHYISNLDNQYEEIKTAIEGGVKCVVFKLGNFFNALPIIRGVKTIRKINKNVKIIVSSLYVYNKFATDSIENYKEMEKVIGADFYVRHISDYDSIYQYVKSVVAPTAYEIAEEKIHEEEALVYCNASVGCMAKCSFCNFPIRNKEYHCIETEELKKKLDEFEHGGKKFLCFYDDTFNLPIKHFRDVCDMMISQEYTFEWFAYCRLKELTEEGVELLKRAHCKGVFVGIESSNDSILENMNKGATSKEFSEKVALLKKSGILVFAFILVGFPGETKGTVYDTIRFLQESKIDFFTANLWYADVSTPIYERASEFQLKGKDFLWEHSNMNSTEASQLTNMVMKDVTEIAWVPNENFGFQAVAYLFSLGFKIQDIKTLLLHMKNLIEANDVCDAKIRANSVQELKKILFEHFVLQEAE